MIIDDIYRLEIDQWTDMQGHLPVLRELARGLELVVELGVRDGVSTAGLLAGRPRRMISIDIAPPSPRLARLTAAAEQAWVRWEYRQADSLEIELEDGIDLLMIDTLHTHDQLATELARHAGRVRPGGRIVMHDTVTFGLVDEPVYAHASRWIRDAVPSGSMGLRGAIASFLSARNDWRVEIEYEQCHGLMVLRRDEA